MWKADRARTMLEKLSAIWFLLQGELLLQFLIKHELIHLKSTKRKKLGAAGLLIGH